MTMKPEIRLLVQVFFLHLIIRCHCKEVGEDCIVKSTGEEGICKISNDCPSVQEQAKRGINPTICGFHQLTIPVVCCEKSIANIPSPNDLGIGEASIQYPAEETPNLQGNSYFSGAARKSEQKCLEYTKAVTDVVHAIPLVTHVEPISINVTKCEYNSVPLIVGGTPAFAGEFPFMAAIGFDVTDDNTVEWRCGGTLISNKWVLTAAHCTFDRSGSIPSKVRFGDLDLRRTDDSEHRDYHVDQILAHPKYKYPEKYHDIALLSTSTTVIFTKYIRPACLYTNLGFEQKSALATGWGQTDYTGPNSDKLLKVRLNLFPNSECTRAYRNEIQSSSQHILRNGITQTMLCAGDLDGGKDTCLGDSGGPLLITEKHNMCKFYIIGVTSFGKLCGQVNTPAIYTRVSEYVEWIEDTIW